MYHSNNNCRSNSRLDTYKRNIHSFPLAILLAISLSGCEDVQSTQPVTEAVAAKIPEAKPAEVIDYSAIAHEIAKKTLIVDTHIDVPHRLIKNPEDVSRATDSGDFDYPRAVKGGLNAPFMSIYIPAKLQETGGSKALADKLITMVEDVVKAAPDKFALAYSSQDIRRNFSKGLISLPLGMENGSAIEEDLENVSYFYKRGIRYITLAHSKANHISDSSYDEERPAQGLTTFGKTLIGEMNKVGIMIDVSHITDQAFYDVIKFSRTPVIASHSSARHFTEGFERNMSDKMIKTLAINGGVIQVNFGSSFITQTAMDYTKKRKAAIKAYQEQNKFDDESAELKTFKEAYQVSTPYPFATLDDVLDHFDHIVKIAGINAVGIGSDYDGVGDSLPTGLKDVSTYPVLIEGLLKRGYSKQDIKKVLSGNIMRVWQTVEVYAASHKS